MDKKRKEIFSGNAVSDVYEWSLGGYDQKVLIEGKKETLPIVVTLHGGPGTPIPFCVGCRGLFPQYTDRFIMVYWDQLGCGINNHIIDDGFTIDSFVQMTIDLIGEVRELFPDNKIYVLSMSWGSILSAKILEQSAHLVDGVVAWGQIVKEPLLNDEVIDALEKSKLSRKKLAVIKAVRKENASSRELQLISSSIRKYTSGYQNKSGVQMPMGKIVKGIMTSPDYRFRDFKAMIFNGYQGNRSLWDEILFLDLSDLLGSVEIPYVILQGDTDIVTSTQKVKKLADHADNPNLKCLVIENSGHIFGADGAEKTFEMLCRMAGCA